MSQGQAAACTRCGKAVGFLYDATSFSCIVLQEEICLFLTDMPCIECRGSGDAFKSSVNKDNEFLPSVLGAGYAQTDCSL